MEQALIDRLQRRIEFAASEIDEENNSIAEVLEKLANFPGFPPEAKAVLLEINDIALSIELETDEIRETFNWFKERIATGGKKNG